ncbi:MAG: hypothetical protein AAB448_01960 [Patescibacteria group bacterium]
MNVVEPLLLKAMQYGAIVGEIALLMFLMRHSTKASAECTTEGLILRFAPSLHVVKWIALGGSVLLLAFSPSLFTDVQVAQDFSQLAIYLALFSIPFFMLAKVRYVLSDTQIVYYGIFGKRSVLWKDIDEVCLIKRGRELSKLFFYTHGKNVLVLSALIEGFQEGIGYMQKKLNKKVQKQLQDAQNST